MSVPPPAPLLAIEKLSPDKSLPFPAYFVASTAPINIEDNPTSPKQADKSLTDPDELIQEMSQHLAKHPDEAEILIVIHGYNTSKSNVKDWFERISSHLAQHCPTRPQGLLLIGYRWPSEQIFPSAPDQEKGNSFKDKLQAAKAALPVILGKISGWGVIGAIGGIVGLLISLVAIALQVPKAIVLLAIAIALTMLSLAALAPIATILFLRLVGYFRDSYRATNFGVSDLVELIRQIDQALVQSQSENPTNSAQTWDQNRIKLSFIGHSMGGFVVTNAVRILSDVFDPRSIGSLNVTGKQKDPSPSIGNVFCLGRLVLVSPDIPAETIISGRANFLQSSLRRFEEAYLFSNEGDMALRLASTAANYFSYPARTQDGGYRLGNVTIRNAVGQPETEQTTKNQAFKEGAAQRSTYGAIVRLPNGQLVRLESNQQIAIQGYPLDYLFIREQRPLSARQEQVALIKDQKPIGEFFTFFDCTDYIEQAVDKKGQKRSVGVITHALRKQSLAFWDYVSLTIDYFSGKIDTHGGYFSEGERDLQKDLKPEAALTKLAIYGLACLGIEKFLLELPEKELFAEYEASFHQMVMDLETQQSDLTEDQRKKIALLQTFSNLCGDRGVQVLLAQERYTRNILGSTKQVPEEKL